MVDTESVWVAGISIGFDWFAFDSEREDEITEALLELGARDVEGPMIHGGMVVTFEMDGKLPENTTILRNLVIDTINKVLET